MRKAALAAFAILFTASMAHAADLPRSQSVYVPAPRSVNDWTGFYVGGNVGGGWASAETDFSIGGGATFANAVNNLTGVLGGAQLGYNWQTGPAVFGVEADIQLTGMRGTLQAPTCVAAVCGVTTNASYSQKLPWFGTVRGRLGYAQDSWLIYGTGGYAYARLETEASATAGAASVNLSREETRSGWAVGGGVELAFTRNWTARVEYLYVDLGRKDAVLAIPGIATIGEDSRVTQNVVRLGVNYRF
jgi:outer membrane immunogenic protein